MAAIGMILIAFGSMIEGDAGLTLGIIGICFMAFGALKGYITSKRRRYYLARPMRGGLVGQIVKTFFTF